MRVAVCVAVQRNLAPTAALQGSDLPLEPRRDDPWARPDPPARPARALLIAGDQAGSPGTPTPGAMAALAVVASDLQLRFASAGVEIETLCTAPTKQHVMTGFAKLLTTVRPNDLLVVMFAGHGKEPDPRDAQPAQAWSLTDDQDFTDLELATALLAFPTGVDVVVICDCCYGEGFFEAGAVLPERLQRLRDTRDRAWQDVANNSPMVCISAASDVGQVTLTKLVELANDTVAAAAAGHSYAQLATTFDQNKLTGREFHVDARPAERLGDAVLSTTATPPGARASEAVCAARHNRG